jgi:hypothetical protein
LVESPVSKPSSSLKDAVLAKRVENNPMHSRKSARTGGYGFYEISLDPSGKSGVY